MYLQIGNDFKGKILKAVKALMQHLNKRKSKNDTYEDNTHFLYDIIIIITFLVWVYIERNLTSIFILRVDSFFPWFSIIILEKNQFFWELNYY